MFIIFRYLFYIYIYLFNNETLTEHRHINKLANIMGLINIKKHEHFVSGISNHL